MSGKAFQLNFILHCLYSLFCTDCLNLNWIWIGVISIHVYKLVIAYQNLESLERILCEFQTISWSERIKEQDSVCGNPMYKMKNKVIFVYYTKLSIKHVHSPFNPHPSPPTLKMIDLSKPLAFITKNTAVQVRYLWSGLTFYALEFSQNMSPTSFNSIQIMFY